MWRFDLKLTLSFAGHLKGQFSLCASLLVTSHHLLLIFLQGKWTDLSQSACQNWDGSVCWVGVCRRGILVCCFEHVLYVLSLFFFLSLISVLAMFLPSVSWEQKCYRAGSDWLSRYQECVRFGRGSIHEEVKCDTSLKTITINTPDHISSPVTLKLRAFTHPCSTLLFLRHIKPLSLGFSVENHPSERCQLIPLIRVWKTALCV